MANTTPDKMRGLLVPTINITKDNIWPEQSTFTQQNSRAGVALPSQSYTGLSLAMAGSQTQDITVETVEGGTPALEFGCDICRAPADRRAHV